MKEALWFATAAVLLWAISGFLRHSKKGQAARDHASLMKDIKRLEENELLRNWPE